MKTLQLCRTVTANGTFFYIDGKRVTLEAFQLAKFGRRQDCFVTRSTRHAVKDFSTVYIPTP